MAPSPFSYWQEEEIEALLDAFLAARGPTERLMNSSCLRNEMLFRAAARELRERGYNRTSMQCRSKFKILRMDFYKAREAYEGSPPRHKRMPFYAKMHTLWQIAGQPSWRNRLPAGAGRASQGRAEEEEEEEEAEEEAGGRPGGGHAPTPKVEAAWETEREGTLEPSPSPEKQPQHGEDRGQEDAGIPHEHTEGAPLPDVPGQHAPSGSSSPGSKEPSQICLEAEEDPEDPGRLAHLPSTSQRSGEDMPSAALSSSTLPSEGLPCLRFGLWGSGKERLHWHAGTPSETFEPGTQAAFSGDMVDVAGAVQLALASERVTAGNDCAGAERALPAADTGMEAPEEMDEFHFLLCEGCQGPVQSPKLLPCLHNLCSECLEETKPIGQCSVCGTVHSQGTGSSRVQDNILFISLQAKLDIYRKIAKTEDATCDSCKNEVGFWCADCSQLFCASCFGFHQSILKRESHEARPLKDPQLASRKEFLAGLKRLNKLFCSKEDHSSQPLILYCNQCKQSMCCICALLDRSHSDQHCEIQREIQSRQRDLRRMHEELQEKKKNYDETYNSLQEQVKKEEEAKSKMRELIEQRFDEMEQLLRERKEKLLAQVENKHKQQVCEVEKKLEVMGGVIKRMTSSEQLMEKMDLYASNQELMEMHPYIKESLEELKEKQPPAVDFQVQEGNFSDIEDELNHLSERLTREREPVLPVLESVFNGVDNTAKTGSTNSNYSCKATISEKVCRTVNDVGKSSAKRKHQKEEKSFQSPGKKVKVGPGCDATWVTPNRPSCDSLSEEPGTSSAALLANHTIGSEDNLKEDTVNSSHILLSSETDAGSSSSEEETTDDESVDSVLLRDIISSQTNQQESTRPPSNKPLEYDSGHGTMVFFDLKRSPQNLLHLSAVTEEGSCNVLIPPVLSHPEGNYTFWEIAVKELISFLQTICRPILIGYNIWSMDFLTLIHALQLVNLEEKLEASVFGFLDALPLIKEKIPDVNNYSLGKLSSIYLWGQLDATKAAECASALKDVCTVLEVNPVIQRKPVIPYSALRCYTSLQPLVLNKLLSRASAQSLALHNVTLPILQSVFEKNPEKGLKRLGRYLNSRRGTVKKIGNLSKICLYFQISAFE